MGATSKFVPPSSSFFLRVEISRQIDLTVYRVGRKKKVRYGGKTVDGSVIERANEKRHKIAMTDALLFPPSLNIQPSFYQTLFFISAPLIPE